MADFLMCEENESILLEVIGGEGDADSGCFEELEAHTDGAVALKHVPCVTVEGDRVLVHIGSEKHPMLPEHYIMFIYMETENGGQIKRLQPGDEPEAEFILAPGDSLKKVYAYCNIHGLWK